VRRYLALHHSPTANQPVRILIHLSSSRPRPGSGFHLLPELNPLASEAVFDKITMSAFQGTPLDIALRDCGIQAFAIVGIAMEIGIEPTVRHALLLATFLCLLWTPVGSDTTTRQSVPSPAWNSPAMLCLQMSRPSVLNFGAQAVNQQPLQYDRNQNRTGSAGSEFVPKA
jgi:Isochorismatase family